MRLKNLLSLAAGIMLLWSPAFAQDGYNIKVKVNGLRDSLCYLANYYGDKQYLKDSCNADATGSFVFKGAEKLPGGIYLVVLPGKKYFEIIVDKQQQFSIETNTGDYVKDMKVKGSAENDLFYNYLKFINSKTAEIEPLRNEYEQVKDDKQKAEALRNRMSLIDSAVFNYKADLQAKNPDFILSKVFRATTDIQLPEAPKNPDGSKDSIYIFNWYKQHYWDNIDLQDDRLLYTPVFAPKLEQYFKKMTLQMPDSVNKEADNLIPKLKPNSEMYKYVVWWITNTYETSNIMGMDAVFVHMAKTYYTKEKAYWVDEAQLFKIQDRAKILEPILIGKKVQNLVLTDTLNVPHALYDVKSKFTILYFWDPDCGHCQKITPKLNEMYNDLKSKGYDIQVYAACTEVEVEKWKKFIREHDLHFINVADPELHNNFRHEFDITTTPQTYLLDANKVIIAKKIEVDTLKDIIERKDKETAGK